MQPISKHPAYSILKSMKQRCYYSKNIGYNYYGGRGIKICEEWLEDSSAFINWIVNNGWKKGLQIDRYPDQNGDYGPSNCRVVPALLNTRNKRSNVKILFRGETKCMSEWEELYGLTKGVIRMRLKRGWEIEKAITTPQLFKKWQRSVI